MFLEEDNICSLLRITKCYSFLWYNLNVSGVFIDDSFFILNDRFLNIIRVVFNLNVIIYYD